MDKKLKRKLIALLWMICGSSLMFALLLIMNEYIEKPKPTDSLSNTAFEINKPKKKKKQKTKKRKAKKKKRRSRKAQRPAAPRLSSSLSGLDFGLPSFDASQIGTVGENILGNMKDLVMTEESVDTAPVPRAQGGVVYPDSARKKGVTGFVTLSLLINTNGDVERVKILESKPHGVFDEAATKAVQDWSFDPALYKGQPVKLWARQTLRFDLK